MEVRAAALLVLSACSAYGPGPSAPSDLAALSLVGGTGETLNVRGIAARARLTVFVFFGEDCLCLDVHAARLRALDEQYRAQGAQFFWIDSEVGNSPERDLAETHRRGYSFPILTDRDAKLADWFGADFVTYSVVLDSAGRVRYRGGIDSDKNHLRADATPYLQNALEDLLAGREPRLAEGEALGCTLRKK